MEELRGILQIYKEKAEKRVQVLEKSDREQLLEQRKLIETQMGGIRADIAAVFGELCAKLESERVEGIKVMREASKDYLSLKDRTGEKTITESYEVSDAKWYKPWTWGKSHTEYTSHTEHYSYCMAADAIENLKKYSIDATGHVERVFSDTLQFKELKRKLLNVIVNNFDMGSEKYDSSLFKIMVEETVSNIEFPVFNLDITDAMNGIAGKFNGEITSADKKTELSVALSKAVSRIYDELCKRLNDTVKDFKRNMAQIGKNVEETLLQNITQEFESLLMQCENKEIEISGYKAYATILEDKLTGLR